MKQKAETTYTDIEALMAGVREGGTKVTNMNKVTETLQKSDGSPAQFYERLREAYHLHSPFNPEAPEKSANGQCHLCGASPGGH
jgi:hypothetical protein